MWEVQENKVQVQVNKVQVKQTLVHKVQVKQNRITKTLCNNCGTKTRLKPLYEQLQVLNIDEI